jgi:hypothetical protein
MIPSLESIEVFFRDYASTIAAFAATASAIAAWRSANRASVSARESSRGLAMSLRPGLRVHVECSSLDDDPSHLFTVENVTPNPAVDVSVKIETARRRLIAKDYRSRIPGSMPENLEGEPWMKFNVLHARIIEKSRDEFTFIITPRFSDQYFIQRWEQKVTMTYEVVTFISTEVGSWTTTHRSEIRPYRRYRALIVWP